MKTAYVHAIILSVGAVAIGITVAICTIHLDGFDDIRSLLKESGGEMVEHGDWTPKVIDSIPYEVTKIRARWTIEGTPRVVTIGAVRGNGNAYTLDPDNLQKFLDGDVSVLPKKEELNVK